VGYGDLTPTTGLGRLLGAIAVVVGLVVLSLPITIVSSNFNEEFARYTQCVQSGGDGFRLTTAEFRAAGYKGSGGASAKDLVARAAEAKPARLALLGVKKGLDREASEAVVSSPGGGGLAHSAGEASIRSAGAGGDAGFSASEGKAAAALEALRAEVAELRAEGAHVRAALAALLSTQGIAAPPAVPPASPN
jgi:hypothetical protein